MANQQEVPTFLEEYQQFTRTTAFYPEDKALEYLGLGLASEAGEVAGVLKKYIRDKGTDNEISSDLLKEKLNKELGDCCWYIFRLCDTLGLDFEQVLADNMDKLTKRKDAQTLSGSGDNR